ncbi:MAG: tRNA lysidine(34) synthetase TilS [Muribaculaceae bacterium]
MDIFEQKTANFIREADLLKADGSNVIVAISGGADSVALLAVLTSLGYNCIAAHCNFHLRGEESCRDERHVEAICSKLAVTLEKTDFDVPQRMAQTGESLEMACRSLRYEWFETLREKYSAQALATGHHREDNVETMLLNLLRSTGIAGAAGISAKNARRVSPLLRFSKTEITEYLQRRGLDYVTDSSNLVSDVQRNAIRNEILPAIEAFFPEARKNLSHSAECLSEDKMLFSDMINSLKSRILSDSELNFAALENATTHPAALLYHLLSPLGFNRSTTDDIFASRGISGKEFYSHEYKAVTSRSTLQISPISKEKAVAVRLDLSETAENPFFTIEKVTIFVPCNDPNIAFFDATIFEGNPVWELRPWQQGDKMKPFGLNGKSKKLSDIFTNCKLSLTEKEKIRILTRNGEIVWIPGIKTSNLFRVTPSTTEIYKLTTVMP